VSVVVPFHGDDGHARAMLAALGRIELGPDDELIVADNTGAAVVERAAADGPPRTRVVQADVERSSYYARNVGAEAASGEWLLFVDSDTRPIPDLVDRYLAEPPGERVGIVAGGVRSAEGQASLAARYAHSRGHISEEWHLRTGPYPAGVTANLLVRRSAWEALGGFHEGVRSGADVEFCWRAQQLGWGLVHRPEASVEHVHPETIPELLRKARRHSAGRVWVNRLYDGALPRPTLIRPLARSVAGVLVWTLTGQFERARFKWLDGRMSVANWRGYLFGDNRAERPGVPPSSPAAGRPSIVMATDAFPARSETFVYNEARRLRELGWGVRVESLARSVRPERSVLREFATSFGEDEPYPDKVRAVAWLAARHPLRCLWDMGKRRRWKREEHPWRLASIAPSVRRLARGGEAHVHVHFGAGAALQFLRAARLAGATYSVAPHAYEIFKQPRNLREKLERAAFVVTDCDYNVRHLRDLVAGQHRDRIHRLVLGVDTGTFRRTAPYPGGRTVVSVGRLVEKKGFEYLIDAAALLRDREALDRLVICGDGPLRDELLERIAEGGLGDTAQIVRGWGAAQVRALLESADLFCLACVVAADGDRDSMPVVVKEALAMEIPVAGSDEVGMPEMVRAEWGRLVPPRDPEALAGAIAELLALPPAERAAMGARGRAFVEAECNLDLETEKLCGLIETAIRR
jgi:glycosyltransferase involved in cell wall biosynthesis/GT2 family glycosyltransferase